MAVRFRMYGSWYAGDTLLKPLPQDPEDMCAAFGELIEEAHAMVGQ